MVDLSDLLKTKEFERVEIEETEKNFNLHLYYRSHSGYTLAETIDFKNDAAILHFVRVYEPPKTKPRRKRGCLPPENFQFALIDDSKELPLNIKSVVVGEDFYSIEGCFVERENKIYLSAGDNPRDIELTAQKPERLKSIIDKMLGGKTLSNPKYGSVTTKLIPEPWPPKTIEVLEVEYAPKRGDHYICEKI